MAYNDAQKFVIHYMRSVFNLYHVLYFVLMCFIRCYRVYLIFHLIKRIYDPKPSCGLFLFTPKTGYKFKFANRANTNFWIYQRCLQGVSIPC